MIRSPRHKSSKSCPVELSIISNKINSEKKKIESIKRMESQLGLTPRPDSPILDTIDEADADIDILESKLNEAREEFKKINSINGQLGMIDNISRRPSMQEERHAELLFRRNTFWKSCCGQVLDRRATQFFTQVFIGSCAMVFCMAKIWTAEKQYDCEGEDISIYIALLSTLIGFYIPSPSMGGKP